MITSDYSTGKRQKVKSVSKPGFIKYIKTSIARGHRGDKGDGKIN